MTIEALYQLFLSSKGICTDTRKIEPGTIFFALKGGNFNGNEFADQAIKEGCIAAIVDEAEFENENCHLVSSVLKCLQELARHHRRQFDIPVLGITGSNGKTTSKELIGAILSKKYNLLITEGNLNNHLGVPFTLLRLNKNHDFAVIEMGANKPGDIKELVEIAEPDYGIITNIGAAHIEGFGSLQGVINTKTEMYRFIEQVNGKLFVNIEDEILVKHLPKVATMTYGENEGGIQGELISLNPFVNFKWRKEHYESPLIETHLVGKYNFTNFLAALAIGNYFGVEPNDMCKALENYRPSNNRSQVNKTERNTLIVDCYNANATSMRAALESFAAMDHSAKWAILGDMKELGDISAEEHQKVVDFLNEHQLQAILVGPEFGKTQHNFEHYPTSQELAEQGNLTTRKNQLILLKGSRGIKLEILIDYL